MKLITEDKIYVEIKDLIYICNLPNFVINEMSLENKSGFEVFKDKLSIDYFIDKQEIINYNSVRTLNDEGIYDLIHSIYEECFKLDVKPNKNLNILLKLEKYEYMIKTLKEYIDYRGILDKKFMEGELIWQTKKNLLKKD